MLEFLNQFRDISIVSIFLKLSLTTLLSGIIGFERGYRGRAAGFRTHILVALGAATIMIINEYAIVYINPDADPTRLGAQVVSGIGFLGAGSIIMTGNNRISGLTTAAGLWASACIGLAAGIGFYELSIVATAFIFFVMTILSRIEGKLRGYVSRIGLSAELISEEKITDLVREMNSMGASIKSFEILRDHPEIVHPGNIMVFLTIAPPSRRSLRSFLDDVFERVDVVWIRESDHH